MVDMDSRLRAARGIGADETQASIEVFQTLKERGHPDGPPPMLPVYPLETWSEVPLLLFCLEGRTLPPRPVLLLLLA